jgi:squalene synthase HpnC
MKIINGLDDYLEILKEDGGKFSVNSLDEAYNFCKKVSLSHYENFPVGSILIPKNYRKYFFSVYFFSRLADDLSDELPNEKPEYRIELLNKLIFLIKSDINENAVKFNPLKIAIKDTILNKNMTYEPFEKLVKAFEMDANFMQPQTMNDNIEYCKFSANPVGELVLRIFDNYDSTTSLYSDSICTGLQFVNFWQDISVDKSKNRIYLPKQILEKYEITQNTLFSNPPKPKLEECLKEIYDYTEKFFIFGFSLIKFIENKRLKIEIALTIEGGKRILEKVEKQGTNIIYVRPKLNKMDVFIIILRLLTKYRIL